MIKIKLLRSILSLDGWNFPVNLFQWAQVRLSVEEFAEFKLVHDQVLAMAKEYTIEPIFENIDGYIVEVGEYHHQPQELFDTPIKKQYAEYATKMKNDPAIVVWNWEEVVE
jgi:hypothetical protein